MKLLSALSTYFQRFTGAIGFKEKRSTTLELRKQLYRMAWGIYYSDETVIRSIDYNNPSGLTLEHLNFSRTAILKIIDYFTSKGFKVKVERNSEVLETSEVYSLFKKDLSTLLTEEPSESYWAKEYVIKTKYLVPQIEATWNHNFLRGITFRRMVETATVAGDLCMYFSPDEEMKEVNITLFDPETVDIIHKKSNIFEIDFVRIKYIYVDEEDVEHDVLMIVDNKQVSTQIDSGIPEIKEHHLGIIPFVHIALNRSTKSQYGSSDLFKIFPVASFLNEKLGDISSIIDYHAEPLVYITGAKMGNLERGNGRVWSNLPKDSKVSSLELKSDLGASLTFVNSLKDYMNSVMSLPKSLIDGTVDKSNISGVSLHTYFKALEDSLTDKEDSFKVGFSLAHEIILKYKEVLGIVDLSPFKSTIIGISFESRLPKDELYDSQIITQDLLNGTTSIHEAMRRRNVTNPEAILRERREETLWESKIEDEALSRGGEYSEENTNIAEKIKKAKGKVIKNTGYLGTPDEQTKLEEGRDK